MCTGYRWKKITKREVRAFQSSEYQNTQLKKNLFRNSYEGQSSAHSNNLEESVLLVCAEVWKVET